MHSKNISSMLTDADISGFLNQHVSVHGRVKSIRNHGFKKFIDIIYANEEIQVISQTEANIVKAAIVQVSGTLVYREGTNVNTQKTHGKYEITDANVIVIQAPLHTLPFDYEDTNTIQKLDDTLKHKHRPLYLRSNYMQNNLRMRDKLNRYIDNYMHERGFIRIETPIITAGTPEGARDFIIPSRLYPGKFYALPQSPQQFKQTLMASGIERYFSIAPCFRDEDGRKDRCFGEFYQLDFECSFASASDIIAFLCTFVTDCINQFKPNSKVQTTHMTYNEAIDIYGSDKPDLRIDVKLINAPKYITDLNIMQKAECVKAIRLALPRSIAESIYKMREQYDMRFEYIYNENDVLIGKLNKFITSHDLQNGEVIFFTGGDYNKVHATLSFIRNQIAKNIPHTCDFALVVVNEFPMFEKDEDGKIGFCHNPFSKVKGLSDLQTNCHNPFSKIKGLGNHWNRTNDCHNYDNDPFSKIKQLGNSCSQNNDCHPDTSGINDFDKESDVYNLNDDTFNSNSNLNMESMLQNDDIYKLRALQYDIVLNGYELASGSERNTDIQELIKYFVMCGYDEAKVRVDFNMMIEAFSYGVPPHAGAAIGVERLLMILIGDHVSSIRDVVAFPLPNSGLDSLSNTPKAMSSEALKIYGIDCNTK